MSVAAPVANLEATPAPSRFRRARLASSLLAQGEPSIWATGGALAVALVMIIGLLGLVLYHGVPTFWPKPLVQIRTVDGKVFLGEVTREETYRPEASAFTALPPEARQKAEAAVNEAGGLARRRLLRTGNYDLTGTHFRWINDFEIADQAEPEWALLIERYTWGNFYGIPNGFLIDGKAKATAPQEVWDAFTLHEPEIRERLNQQIYLERYAIGALSRKENEARLEVRRAELTFGKFSAEHRAAEEAFAGVQRANKKDEDAIKNEIASLNKENNSFQISLVTADGERKTLPLEQIVRAYPANRLGFWDKVGVYFSRWGEFLADRPREANTEGGVFPAIWGTVSMTLLMSLAVVPFGVLAALYLREYAKSGPIISAVRIAINNLAGVPSIVFGVFGLGFFCYLMGAYIDGGPKGIQVEPWPVGQWWLAMLLAAGFATAALILAVVGGRVPPARRSSVGFCAFVLWLLTVTACVILVVKTPYFEGFYQANLPNPTFGTGGVLWSALTLALLTLPVVIVATEEALAAVPSSMREGSYACGASKWQTIRRIVLPRALPGIMTGMILAMARGAGEVAPLMLVGAVKLAPNLPVDEVFPFLHPSRSFMHLGFHIYDVGFQSPDSEAARPMVYTTTLLLITIVALLNVAAVWLRSRLRRRYRVSQF